MAKKLAYWDENQFVTYEEYSAYGISGEIRERNLMHSDKLGISEECRCPLCMKQLKEGSYKILIVPNNTNTTQYYFNPTVKGIPVKIGNGCFKNIMKAYKAKYNK